ncbi:Protein Y40B10A.5 [Aphelenchoides avenae]|nr:Protein Y40B10A.5 [Aphelenchus avenae]
MSSTTETSAPDGYAVFHRDEFPLSFSWFGFFAGLTMSFANFALLSVILLSKRFRTQREYVVLSANMLFDALYGLNFFLGSIWQLRIYYFSGDYVRLFTTFRCASMPHSLLALLTMPGSGTIILVATIDRLLTVLFPFNYPRLPRWYSLGLMFVGYFFPVPVLVSTLIQTAQQSTEIPELCILPIWMPFPLLMTDVYTGLFATVIAVLLYAPILFRVYKLHKNRGETSKITLRERQRIIRTTMTVVLIMTSHLGLLVLPDTVSAMGNMGLGHITMYCRVSKGLVDVSIYLIMQRELRLKLFCTGRKANAGNKVTTLHSLGPARKTTVSLTPIRA